MSDLSHRGNVAGILAAPVPSAVLAAHGLIPWGTTNSLGNKVPPVIGCAPAVVALAVIEQWPRRRDIET